MNIAKNMEAIFVAALVVVSATSFATAGAPAARSSAPAAVQAGADANMTVVTVSAKRLSAAEKAQLKG
ncbi:hypothetical protein LXA47_28920 [Massilia sp. P8910]|uniref:hypothetical protein n=1 Tax=Massilia antarctica TaxID=2765360 RepID=UPI0006BB81A4|nr:MULTISPECIES: hypothetical protein [Massilia]MCE3607597.1 hypothetical protein [Massilia antarctica]MCY0911943.1 hypothetical protein [Massilia sp. H27-R4]CUI06598.1 hypothetical protein BN2497_7973 [Janthinobacterium sp. CG23_2]CUU30384.1 hypothetical protein BN3177_7973 [Janthinobacterium sp. CG23_2]